MNRKIPYIISLFFITILLFKGAATLVPLISSDHKDLLASELMAENESEQNKNGNKTVEFPQEELFDHTVHQLHALQLNLSSPKCIADIGNHLPRVCLDIPTPPPNSFC